MNKLLNFGGDTITVWIQVLFSGFVTTAWEYEMWLTDINLLLILIRQMAAVVRRAFAEVCTVAVLLVDHCITYSVSVLLLP